MTDTEIVRFDAVEEKLSAAPDRVEIFSDPDFQADLQRRLEDMSMDIKVISVDVFDTLLLRDDSSELTRFYQIASLMADIASNHLIRKVKQIDAFIARHLGVKVSYRASDRVLGAREGSLTEIHKVASHLLSGNDELTEEFVRAELEYEKNKISKNELIIGILRMMKGAGCKIAFVSDMYMHDHQIKILLQSVGIAESDFDLLLSSADTKVSKASGGVFPIVEERLNCKPNQVLHLGDSYLGDFKRPIQRGWRAIHLPVPDSSVSRRRADHMKTARLLSSEYGVAVDIKMPE